MGESLRSSEAIERIKNGCGYNYNRYQHARDERFELANTIRRVKPEQKF